MDFLTLEQSVWSRLKEETRPIVLYGMGDGADKILAQFDRLEFARRRARGHRSDPLRAAFQKYICFDRRIPARVDYLPCPNFFYFSHIRT